MRASLRTWSALLLLICALSGAHAEENPVRLAAGDVLRGKFVQERHLEGFSAPLKTTGQFLLAPEKGLIWRAEAPFATTTVMTSRGILQRNEDVETLNLSAGQVPIMAQLYDALGGALAGDLGQLERSFEVERRTDASGWRLILKPRAVGDAEVREIRIDGNRFVEHVEVFKGSGDRDRLTFLDQSADQTPLSDAEMQLLAQPGQQ